MVTYKLVRHSGDMSWKAYCMELFAKNQELQKQLDDAVFQNSKLLAENMELRTSLMKLQADRKGW